jgi:hypothetical protein
LEEKDPKTSASSRLPAAPQPSSSSKARAPASRRAGTALECRSAAARRQRGEPATSDAVSRRGRATPQRLPSPSSSLKSSPAPVLVSSSPGCQLAANPLGRADGAPRPLSARIVVRTKAQRSVQDAPPAPALLPNSVVKVRCASLSSLCGVFFVSAAENLSAQVYFQGRNAMSKLRKKHFAMAVFPQQHFF